MKKLVRILLPFVCLNACLLSSCGKDKKIQLSFGDIHATSYDDTFTIDDLDKKIEDKESFLLTVADTTCACWSEFRSVLQNYITETHVYCAYLTYANFNSVASNYGIELTKGSTKFVIFKEGEVKVQIKTDIKDKTMKDLNEFKKFMESNIYLPKVFFIKEEDYATVTANGAVIYFERSGCGDCSYLNPTILANYVKNHKDMKNIYVLDCQPWKSLSETDYQTKKDDFGLSNKYNVNYGFDRGVFPFFSYIKGNEYQSGAVAFNETVVKQDNKYVVTNSYYSEDRASKLEYLNNVSRKVITGMEISSNDIADNGDSITWMKDKSVKVYEPLIDAFLDYYLPRVGYSF